MEKLFSFLPYYGGKYRLASRYPEPQFKRVIEPFCGGAGYSTYYYNRDVCLYDIDPTLVGIWDYLIHVRATELNRLPIQFDSTDDLSICQEAKWLIGFWLHPASSRPAKRATTWAIRDKGKTSRYWGERRRAILAHQLKFIRHWKIKQKSYEQIRQCAATWFIDPPYQGACGRAYKFHTIDYTMLGQWCRSRKGQVLVCEQAGANWLNFRPFCSLITSHKNTYSREVLWQKFGRNLKTKTALGV